MKNALTPKAIVAALDEHIIGQADAKRAVAVALRNRWRRQRLGADLRDEVTPKNILMIGPTGCGKTEISRRLAKLADAPFIKVEATKFTEVGYVGRDVEQIARDLAEEAVRLEKERRREHVREAAEAEEREFYAHRAPGQWLQALAPLGTDADKPFLEIAPWLIAVFYERTGVDRARLVRSGLGAARQRQRARQRGFGTVAGWRQVVAVHGQHQRAAGAERDRRQVLERVVAHLGQRLRVLRVVAAPAVMGLRQAGA